MCNLAFTHYLLTMLRTVAHLRTGMEKHLSRAKLPVELGKEKQEDSWPRFARKPLLKDRSMVICKNVSPRLAPCLCQWPHVDPEGPHLVWDTQEKSMHSTTPLQNPSLPPRNMGRVSVTAYVMPLWAQLPLTLLLGRGPSSVSAGSFSSCLGSPQTSLALLCCGWLRYGNR